jgi:hypothetical protein
VAAGGWAEAVASVDVADSLAAAVPVEAAPVADGKLLAEALYFAAATDAVVRGAGKADTDFVLLADEVVVAAAAVVVGAVVVAAVAAVVGGVDVAAVPVEPFEPLAFSSFSFRYYEQVAAVAASMSMRRCTPRTTSRIGKETLLIAWPSVVAFSTNPVARWAFVASIDGH